MFSLDRQFSMFFSCIKLWYKHFKLIESSPKLNIIYAFRTLVPQTILYSVSIQNKVVEWFCFGVLAKLVERVLSMHEITGSAATFSSMQEVYLIAWLVERQTEDSVIGRLKSPCSIHCQSTIYTFTHIHWINIYPSSFTNYQYLLNHKLTDI